MFVLKRLFVCLLVTTLLFTACKKDAAITDLTPSSPTTETTTTQATNEAINFRALAAAAKVSHNKEESFSEEENPCGCYDVFEEIDFDASDKDIETAIDAIIDGLSEEELIRLFEPVCTDDGEIYESACVADCEGITNYHVCTNEELDDYFFDDFECGTIDNYSFPFEFELPDGTTTTVNSEEELFAALEQWYEAHGGEYGDWEEWEDFGECYSIAYPVQLTLPDATVVDVDSDEALITVFEEWYKANPESEEEPTPVFPVNVILKDGTTKTINSDEEIDALEKDCFGDWEGEWEEEEWEDFGECYSIVYPVQVTNPDGTVQTYNSDEELFKGLEDWYEANPESEEEPNPVYPIEVLLEDGTTQTINSDEEGEDLEDSCYGDFDDDICFDLVFPMTLTTFDSTSIQVNNEDELEDALETIFKDVEEIDELDEATILALITPFDIQYDDGTIATINSLEDIEVAIFKCFGFGLKETGSVKDVLLNTNSTDNSFLLSRKSK